ncbi:SDR family NAD(P)-dependent oxidoreductase, partial [Nocardia vulneris]|uniref:SDR family NAD(P)-dependent oxidoreductase n=1 Tax=Nocardia vulneris TaxID=1141657 RepID=UPI0012E0A9CE
QRRRYWLSFNGETRSSDAIDTEFWRRVEQGDMAALGIDTERSFGEVLPLLLSLRQKRQIWATVDSWCYRIEWRLLRDEPVRARGRWLVVGSACVGVVEAVIGAFREADIDVDYIDLDANQMSRSGLASLLQNKAGTGKVAGVLSLAAIDERPSSNWPSMTQGLQVNLLLLQAFADIDADLPLWCVTSGAVEIGNLEQITSTMQVQMWGMGQVASLEYPRWWGGLIDLSETSDRIVLQRMIASLSRSDGEDQLAVRPSGVYGRRMVRAVLPESLKSEGWKPRGTVLITGGTGGIGGYLARWAAANGAQHVVLASRRGYNAQGAQELEMGLRALGSRVTIVTCDVTRREDVAALLSVTDSDAAPLTAVIHAAGNGLLSPITETDPELFETVTGPKVVGVQHLDELLGDRVLDAFVLFSSGAATWGNAGGAAYAAGNAFLDGLAQRRRSRGLTATSLAWGGWAAGGMAGTREAAEYLTRNGVQLMDPDSALAALPRVVGCGEATMTVANLNWRQFVPLYTLSRHRSLIQELPETQSVLQSAQEEPEAESLAVLR